MRLHLGDDGVEDGRVADGQLAEHLEDQLHARSRQGRDEAVVVGAALVEGGVQWRDPERAEVRLLRAAVGIGVDVGLAGELEGRTVKRAGSGAKAGGALENAFTFAGMSRAASGAWHDSIVSCEARG